MHNEKKRKLVYCQANHESINNNLFQEQTNKASDNHIFNPKNNRQGCCLDDTQLAQYGIQLCFYFSFLRHFIILFTILVCFALPLVIINSQGNSCSSSISCERTFVLKLSLLNSLDNSLYVDLHAYLGMACFVFILIFSCYQSYRLRKINQNINQKNYFPHNFAVLLKLPNNSYNQLTICGCIEEWWRSNIRQQPQYMKQKFPQLFQAHNQQNSVQGNAIDNLENLLSTTVQKVILSYDYQEWNRAKQSITQILTQYQSKINLKEQISFKEYAQIFQRKKNFLNQNINKTQYALVIFTKKAYTDYFFKINKSGCCCQLQSRKIKWEGSIVEIESCLFSSQILWENMKTESKICKICSIFSSWVIVLLFLSIIVGFQILALILNKKYQFLDSFAVIFALINNILIFLSEKLIDICQKNIKGFVIYHQKQFMTLLQKIFLNAILLVISPVIISVAINQEFIWNKNGDFQIIFFNFTFYLVINSQFDKYLLYITKAISFCCSENQRFCCSFENKQSPISKQFTNILIILFCVCFVAPFQPIFYCQALLWFIFQFFLQKLNIVYFYKNTQFHGARLSQNVLKMILFLLFGMISAHLLVGILLYFKFDGQILSAHLLISGIQMVILIFFLIFSLFDCQNLICQKQKSKYQQSQQVLYKNIKNQFKVLYQDNNQVFCQMNKQTIINQNFKQKICDQMNTLTQTVVLSLKERLLAASQVPMQIPTQTDRHNQDIYFEYQRKVFMEPSKPKFNIPPLFRKEPQIMRSNVPQVEVQMANFNSMFSSDDQQAKREFKKKVKKRLMPSPLQ